MSDGKEFIGVFVWAVFISVVAFIFIPMFFFGAEHPVNAAMFAKLFRLYFTIAIRLLFAGGILLLVLICYWGVRAIGPLWTIAGLLFIVVLLLVKLTRRA